MDFVHNSYQMGETIAAIATPPGEGGIAIIRLSGNNALEIASQLFSGPVKSYASHTAHFGKVIDDKGEIIDEALLLVMLGKRSYTGEDTVEIQCHGGMIAARRVLERVIQAGAKPARAGEFTFKAFMNGKLDLAQAESVQALISAKNEQAFTHAHTVLEGRLSKKVSGFQKELTRLMAILEAWVDFPEEGLEFATLDEIQADLAALRDQINELIVTYHDGKRIHCGINLCIYGAPNVGKSSLMNALLEKERAIVTPIAGTTRDVIEEDMTLGGVHFRLVDTAGIREAEDLVEKEGILRAQKAATSADLILFVLDATRGLTALEKELLSQVPEEKTIVIWNKIDSPHTISELTMPHIVTLSALKTIGLKELKQKIDHVIWRGRAPQKEEIILSSNRHKLALEEAAEAIERVILGFEQNLSPEFLSSDMRSALHQLGTILGTNITEDVLSSIFSQFCIGK